MLRAVVRGAKRAGLRVPPIRLKVVEKIPRLHGYTEGRTITVERASATYELLAHEVAHVVADQIVVDKAASHNRFWALVYGVLYQQVVDR